MRWSYKTVHYEMKKEGLLGSAFLDETEIEFSLNEFGKAGWELVAMLETLDGLIAVFKQPMHLGSRQVPLPDQQAEQPGMPPKMVQPKMVQPQLVTPKREPVEEPRRLEETKIRDKADPEITLIDDYEEEVQEPKVLVDEPPQETSDVGSIRIE